MNCHQWMGREHIPEMIWEKGLARYYRQRIKGKIIVFAIGFFALLLLCLYHFILKSDDSFGNSAVKHEYLTQEYSLFLDNKLVDSNKRQSIMTIGSLIIMSFVLLCGCSGCTSILTNHAAIKKSMENLGLGHQMIAAMQKQDYICFVKDFSRELKESVTRRSFHKLCSDLADRKETIDSWKLLDTLDRGGLYHTEVWKITFLRSEKRGKIHLERLFYVTRAKLDGSNVVIGFRSDPLF